MKPRIQVYRLPGVMTCEVLQFVRLYLFYGISSQILLEFPQGEPLANGL